MECRGYGGLATEHGKYNPELLLRMLRKATAMRNEMLADGFTDNGGAIYSASRILDILCNRLCYPGLRHINSYSRYPSAEYTEAAWAAHCAGEQVRLEHVAPLRHLTVETMRLIAEGATDDEVKEFLKRTYRLVYLTVEETAVLNRKNRSRIDPDRLVGLRVIRRPEAS